MANKVEILIEELVLELLPKEYELVDVEYVKEAGEWYLRIFVDTVDRDTRISLNDCQKISVLVSDMLDEKDPVKEHYMLEVSSPGLDRPLKKKRDFIREKGKEVEIKLYKPLDGKKEYEGILLELTEDDFVKTLIDGDELIVNRKDIAIIRLKVNF